MKMDHRGEFGWGYKLTKVTIIHDNWAAPKRQPSFCASYPNKLLL
jgi:hypothetical protein